MDVRPTPGVARLCLWSAVALLTLVGVTAAAARATFPADLAARAEPVRALLLASLDLTDPRAAERPGEVARFDGVFARHPRLTLLHVVPGGLFLALAPLQFSSRLRDRHRRMHRWTGRVLVPAAGLSVLPGLYFGLRMPFGGRTEALAIALFGGLLLVALARAVVAIRRGQVACHREWMIRAFAVAIGISTVRVVGAVFDVTLTPLGVGPREVFVLSVWTGWITTLGAAELWIAHTRPRAAPLAYRRAG